MRSRAALAVAAAIGAVACGDVVDPALPGEPLSDRLFLYAALDPDRVHQWIAATPVDVRRRPVVHVAVYTKPGGQAGSGWTLVARDSSAGPKDHDHTPECDAVYVHAHCLALHAVLESGAVYMVEATAEGHVAARGVTRVPGDFEVESAAISRRDGSPVLSAAWTASEHVHRYLLGVRRFATICGNCSRAWNLDLDSAGFTGPLPQVVVGGHDHHGGFRP